MQNNKRSQMEIMGLVIIVILVAIGMLFAIQFLMKKPAGQETAAVKESTMAANFLNTLVKSDGACKGRSIGELIQACAEASAVIICENGLNACTQSKSLIMSFLDNVFTQQRKKFYFTIADKNDVIVEDFIIGDPCKGEFESKTRPLVFLGGEVYMKLDICY